MTPFDMSRKEAISPFPTTFSTLSKTEIIIFVTYNLSSANAIKLVWSKILSCGNGLKDGICHEIVVRKEKILLPSIIVLILWLTHSHTMTPFDAPGKQAF